MSSYQVTSELTVEADTPREAVEVARAIGREEREDAYMVFVVYRLDEQGNPITDEPAALFEVSILDGETIEMT
jgi:hypothetical protein